MITQEIALCFFVTCFYIIDFGSGIYLFPEEYVKSRTLLCASAV